MRTINEKNTVKENNYMKQSSYYNLGDSRVINDDTPSKILKKDSPSRRNVITAKKSVYLNTDFDNTLTKKGATPSGRNIIMPGSSNKKRFSSIKNSQINPEILSSEKKSDNRKIGTNTSLEKNHEPRNSNYKVNKTLNSITEKNELNISNFHPEKSFNNEEYSLLIKENEVSINSRRDKYVSDHVMSLNIQSVEKLNTIESVSNNLNIRHQKNDDHYSGFQKKNNRFANSVESIGQTKTSLKVHSFVAGQEKLKEMEDKRTVMYKQKLSFGDPRNREKILNNIFTKCHTLCDNNIHFYDIRVKGQDSLNKTIHYMDKDRAIKRHINGMVFSDLISSGKGIYLHRLRAESEIIRRTMYKRPIFKEHLNFYHKFIMKLKENSKNLDKSIECFCTFLNYMRLLLIEGSIFNEHDAWNIAVFIDWSRSRAENCIESFNGIEKVLLSKLKKFFEKRGLNFPLVIYKD